MKTTNIFFDTEFTGLRKTTTLISIGLVSRCGKAFYAELTDYDENQIDDWIRTNVIANLTMQHLTPNNNEGIIDSDNVEFIRFKGTKSQLKPVLLNWLNQFDKIQMISDCLSHDWLLFIDIFGESSDLPKHIDYIPFDLCTLLRDINEDPDIDRELFSGYTGSTTKHNALHDAIVIKGCWLKATDILNNPSTIKITPPLGDDLSIFIEKAKTIANLMSKGQINQVAEFRYNNVLFFINKDTDTDKEIVRYLEEYAK